jgi:hypothetical protein
MASGHEDRANRPNTWLLRPLLQSEDSSCQPGAVTNVGMSAFWGRADLRPMGRRCLQMTRSGQLAAGSVTSFRQEAGFRHADGADVALGVNFRPKMGLPHICPHLIRI